MMLLWWRSLGRCLRWRQSGDDLRFPVTKLTVNDLLGVPPQPPVIGVSVARDFPVVQQVCPKVQTQFSRAQFMLWRVDAE